MEAVREELRGEAGGDGGSVTQLESELRALRDEVAALRADEGGGGTNGSSSTTPKRTKQLEELIGKAQEQPGK